MCRGVGMYLARFSFCRIQGSGTRLNLGLCISQVFKREGSDIP